MAQERSGRVPKNKPELYKDFTKSLNVIFKAEPDDANNNAAKKIIQFCDAYMPKTADGKTQWVLPLDEDIPNHTLVVLAHSVRPIRCVGEITKNEQCTKAIPLKYRYIVEKFMRKEIYKEIPAVPGDEGQENGDQDDTDDEGEDSKEKKRSNKRARATLARAKRRKVETVMVECGKKQQQLISKKKGFWVIWKPSLEANIKTTDIASHMPTVLDWYSRYVEGMEKNPCETFPRNREDMFSEQFLLDQYPTPEWRKHTQEYQKTNKSNKGGDSHATTQPPPPPPNTPLDSKGNLSPMSSSCSVPDEDDEPSSKKKPQRKSSKKKRPQQQAKERKKKISHEPTCDLETSAQDLQLFDAGAFSRFMEQFRNPELPKNDILDFEDLGDLPELDLMNDVVSV